MHSNDLLRLRFPAVLFVLMWSLPALGLEVWDSAKYRAWSIWEAGEKADAALKRIRKAEAQAEQAQADAQEGLEAVQAQAQKAGEAVLRQQQELGRMKTEAQKTAEAALRQQQEIGRMEAQVQIRTKELHVTMEQQQEDVNERLRQLNSQVSTAKLQSEETLRRANEQLGALGRDRDELRQDINGLAKQRDAVIAKLKMLGLILALLAFFPVFWRPLWRVCVVLALRHLSPGPRQVGGFCPRRVGSPPAAKKKEQQVEEATEA